MSIIDEKWLVGESLGGGLGVWRGDESDDLICKLPAGEGQTERANLIAAAPGLLSAAKDLLDVIAEPNGIAQDHMMDNALQAMADAIAKAEVKS